MSERDTCFLEPTGDDAMLSPTHAELHCWFDFRQNITLEHQRAERLRVEPPFFLPLLSARKHLLHVVLYHPYFLPRFNPIQLHSKEPKAAHSSPNAFLTLLFVLIPGLKTTVEM